MALLASALGYSSAISVVSLQIWHVYAVTLGKCSEYGVMTFPQSEKLHDQNLFLIKICDNVKSISPTCKKMASRFVL